VYQTTTHSSAASQPATPYLDPPAAVVKGRRTTRATTPSNHHKKTRSADSRAKLVPNKAIGRTRILSDRMMSSNSRVSRTQ
jgi:hypothetical protein